MKVSTVGKPRMMSKAKILFREEMCASSWLFLLHVKISFKEDPSAVISTFTIIPPMKNNNMITKDAATEPERAHTHMPVQLVD